MPLTILADGTVLGWVQSVSDESLRNCASLDLVDSLAGGAYRATYEITSLSGWSAIENGAYTVKLVGGPVEDIIGVAASARTLGTFRVKIG